MNKYPKRGEDCEYTNDCMWGVDGWCDRPEGWKCVAQETTDKATKEAALQRLVKLGDMIGDGLNHEPGGKWIEKEYRRAMKEAGIIEPKRHSNASDINVFMEKRTKEEMCTCGGALVQNRSGSFRAKCAECGKVWQLGGRA